jgi:hypothetical protein
MICNLLSLHRVYKNFLKKMTDPQSTAIRNHQLQLTSESHDGPSTGSKRKRDHTTNQDSGDKRHKPDWMSNVYKQPRNPSQSTSNNPPPDSSSPAYGEIPSAQTLEIRSQLNVKGLPVQDITWLKEQVRLLLFPTRLASRLIMINQSALPLFPTDRPTRTLSLL